MAAAAAVVAILVGVQLLGGDDTPATAADFQDRNEILALVEGIPQNGNTIGDPKAPVTITEFADLQCSACALASKGIVRELITTQVRPGKVNMEIRAVRIFGPDSERGAFALEAANMQDKGWTYAELVLANQGPEDGGWLTDELAEAAAEAAGLDVARWKRDFQGEEVASVYAENAAAFQAAGARATPTFVIDGPGERTVFSGLAELKQFESAIAKAGGTSD